MAKTEVYLPSMGEGIIEAAITKWLKKEGDRIEEDETILEVATDKVDSEIPSPADGVIVKIFFKEGDVPKIGDILAIIADENENIQELKKEEPVNKIPEIKTFASTEDESVTTKVEVSEDSPNTVGSRTPSGKFLSPLVRNIANKENISLVELDTISGSGSDGRISKDDVLMYLSTRQTGDMGIVLPKKADRHVSDSETLVKSDVLPAKKSALSYDDSVELIEMNRMRKLIADHMVKSKQISPHVTSFVEIDVTDLVTWRDKNKDLFFSREKEKITFTPIFVEAASRALLDFPMVNVSVDGSTIIRKKNINIGVATALPDGNLIVPVIKNADRMNLVGLAKSVNDLANRARRSKLLPDEIQGGTFTITNFGSFDNITGTPIINQPEVAILGVGAIKKKPAVVETPQGDFIAIRQIMILSLAYDHRVVDGALGGMFLRRVGDYLEKWDMSRTI